MSDVNPRWRSPESAPGGVMPRRHAVLILLLVAAALTALLVVALPYLRPPVRSTLAVLCVRPDLPWRAQDRDALVTGDYFGATVAPDGPLDQAAVVRELSALRAQTGTLVVYLSGPARTDARGRACLLPADADPDDPATWLPLVRVQELLRQGKAARRLLVLDLVPVDDVPLEVPADGLTLIAAGPGQEPTASEHLGRSVFGHHVEMGLRGQADANGDGRVSARELAAYVRERVDRWTRRTRGVRQVPTLLGTGRDFALVDLPNARPRAVPDYPEERAYPKWLAEAWAKSSDLLPVERAWRDGGDEDALRARATAIVARTAPATVRPPARSLAQYGRPPRDRVDAVREYASRLEARLRGLAADKAAPLRAQAVEAFLKENKPTPDLLAACVEAVTAEPRFLDSVRAVIAAAEPRPEYVETLTLDRLSALGLPLPLLQRCLELMQMGERAASVPRGFERVRAEVESAAQKRHEALVLLESRGYAPAARGEKLLDEARAGYVRVLARQSADSAALETLDRARVELPNVLAYLRHAGHAAPGWLPAAEMALTLARSLDDADEASLRARLDELDVPFTSEGVEGRIRAARRGTALPGHWRELDGLLATTLVPRRVDVWTASRDLARRLEEEAWRLDRNDGSRLGPAVADPPPPDPAARQERERQRAALAALATVPAASSAALWSWQADRLRYEARDHLALQPDSAAAAFYARAAQDYRSWLAPGREPHAEIIEASDPPRLLPAAPITVALDVRTTGPAVLDVLTPDDEWLDVQPRSLPTTGGLVPVKVSLRAAAGVGGAPAPLGMLARATVGGRTYHRRINVPLSPRLPEIVLAPEGGTPGEPSAGLRLRAVPGRQPFAVYLRNPIDRPWRKLVVRLATGAEVRESLPLALAGREVRRIEFAPGAAPPAVLPEVAALTFTVLDQDGKNETVLTRTVPVGLAAPADYARVTGVRFDPAAGRNRLEVRVRLRAAVGAPDVTAELQLPPPEEGGAAYTAGTLRGKLSPKGEELVLFAEGVRSTDDHARFAVGVDAWPRGFGFRTTLAPRGGVAAPEPIVGPGIRVRVGPYGQAGPNFAVPLEVDNAPEGSAVEVMLGRLSGGVFVEELSARREGGRDQRIGFALVGSVLHFEAMMRDWTVLLDTSRIRGPRAVRARLFDRGGRELAVVTRSVVLGDQAPDGVRFVNPPARAWNKAPLALVATGGDTVVGLKDVSFFVGKPVGDKLPEGVTPTLATPTDAARTTWAVKLPVPADRKGPTEVSVRFVNAIGLSAYATTTVDLSDDDPEKSKPGTITGRLVEGDRPQPGLDVVLSDEKGAEKARVKTKADGTFELKGLAPGKYRLGAVKTSNGRKASYPRAPTEFIELAPGGSVTAELMLFL